MPSVYHLRRKVQLMWWRMQETGSANLPSDCNKCSPSGPPTRGMKVQKLGEWTKNSPRVGERIYKVLKFITLFEFFFLCHFFFSLDICCEDYLWFHWVVLDIEASSLLKKKHQVLYRKMLELISKNAQIIVLCLSMGILY